MTTDRDLLELAAKAAGIEIEPFMEGRKPHKLIDHESGEGSVSVLWNPLTDDGDALRLAVKLGMRIDIDHHNKVVEATVGYEDNTTTVYETIIDNVVSTRRAIVRAAAEIGRNMK